MDDAQTRLITLNRREIDKSKNALGSDVSPSFAARSRCAHRVDPIGEFRNSLVPARNAVPHVLKDSRSRQSR
jgi:hypothetical protein